eukprot:1443223-Pleurochrysis_carterae.AAC.4
MHCPLTTGCRPNRINYNLPEKSRHVLGVNCSWFTFRSTQSTNIAADMAHAPGLDIAYGNKQLILMQCLRQSKMKRTNPQL